MPKNNLSVVIATYNRGELALDLAKSILKQQSVEVIIVEQISDLIESKHPRVKVIKSKIANLPYARNLGIKESRGEVILFLDDDVEITKKLLETHLSYYENKSVVGVAGRVINDGEEAQGSSSEATGQTNSLLTRFTKNFSSTKPQTVQFPYGCHMSFRKSALLKTGGFDKNFPPPLSAFEEIDLGLRVGKYGQIIFTPETLVYHHQAKSGGTRTNKLEKQKLYYFSYGRLVRKHTRGVAQVLSLLLLTLRIFKEGYKAIPSFYRGYLAKL